MKTKTNPRRPTPEALRAGAIAERLTRALEARYTGSSPAIDAARAELRGVIADEQDDMPNDEKLARREAALAAFDAVIADSRRAGA